MHGCRQSERSQVQASANVPGRVEMRQRGGGGQGEERGTRATRAGTSTTTSSSSTTSLCLPRYGHDSRHIASAVITAATSPHHHHTASRNHASTTTSSSSSVCPDTATTAATSRARSSQLPRHLTTITPPRATTKPAKWPARSIREGRRRGGAQRDGRGERMGRMQGKPEQPPTIPSPRKMHSARQLTCASLLRGYRAGQGVRSGLRGVYND